MIPFLLTHLKLSAILALLVVVISKNKVMPNKLRLALLYLILIKSFFPWGLLSFPSKVLRNMQQREVFTYDLWRDNLDLAAGYASPAFSINDLLLFLWITVAAILFVLLMKSLVRIKTLVKTASLCQDDSLNKMSVSLQKRLGLRKQVTLLISNRISSPFVWWNMKWSIVLPESFHTLTDEDKKIVLAHELIHIRRRDFFKFLLLRTIKSVFFFSPFVWLIIGEILNREETETDLQAMSSFHISSLRFGEALLRFVSLTMIEKSPVPTLIISNKRKLKMRLERLFQKKLSRKAKILQRILLLGILPALLFNFSSVATAEKKVTNDVMQNPLPSGRLTMTFGIKTHPITKKPYNHKGIDLAAKSGTGIVAALAGKVSKIDYNKGRGHFLVLAHENGYKTSYSHLKDILVGEGVTVDRGEKIATVGNSGVSTAPHLHFELHKDGKTIDPLTTIHL
ncbi:peptidoglycan DD-metalloendopeptidase family protein [bacterium]|nr:peptidoglycan DD-metalloendopeptidase family protein [bacterium]